MPALGQPVSSTFLFSPQFISLRVFLKMKRTWFYNCNPPFQGEKGIKREEEKSLPESKCYLEADKAKLAKTHHLFRGLLLCSSNVIMRASWHDWWMDLSWVYAVIQGWIYRQEVQGSPHFTTPLADSWWSISCQDLPAGCVSHVATGLNIFVLTNLEVKRV